MNAGLLFVRKTRLFGALPPGRLAARKPRACSSGLGRYSATCSWPVRFNSLSGRSPRHSRPRKRSRR